MAYEPTNWKKGDKITSVNLNKLESGIAALYPQEVVIAPEQTLTITAEDAANQEFYGKTITFVDGVETGSTLPSNWIVTVNGILLDYTGFGYGIETEEGLVYDVSGTELGIVRFNCFGESPTTPVPGDYTVEIKESLPTVMTLPDASRLEDGLYKLKVSNGKWIVQHTES